MKRTYYLLILFLFTNIIGAQTKLFSIDNGELVINSSAKNTKKEYTLTDGYVLNSEQIITDAKGYEYKVETFTNDEIYDVGFSDFQALRITCVSDPKGNKVNRKPVVYYNDVWIYWRAYPEYEQSIDTIFKQFDLKDCSALVFNEGGFPDSGELFHTIVIVLYNGNCDMVFNEPALVTNEISVGDDEISINCITDLLISDDEESQTEHYKPLRFCVDQNTGLWGETINTLRE